MKVLVTGGAGFIGSNLVRMLLESTQYEVVNFDALTYAGNLENLQDLTNGWRYSFVNGNICDEKVVMAAMDGCEIVIHLAAESHVDRSITSARQFVKTNVLGTQTLLDCARATGVRRFHHVSTDEVFGELPLDHPDLKFNEWSEYAPRSPYAASKASSDHHVRAAYHTHGLPITISNCSNCYGQYQFPEKMIPLCITNAMQDKPLPIYGRGLAVRDYLDVSDHCRAIIMIVEFGEVGNTYCIGGDSERNGVQVARAVLSACGKPESLIEYVTDRPGHDMRYAIDHSLISDELGWQPVVTFEQGIENTVRWYRDHENWWRRIVSGAYLDTNRAAMNKEAK